MDNVSEKSRTTAFILVFLAGVFGVHRFYAGKVGTGVLWLFTLGLFGVGAMVDFWVILLGGFKDKNNNVISRW